MTLNLKSVAFVPYVGQFSVICLVVLATFDHFVRRLIFRKKRATCRPAAAGKKRERHLASHPLDSLDVMYGCPLMGLFAAERDGGCGF